MSDPDAARQQRDFGESGARRSIDRDASARTCAWAERLGLPGWVEDPGTGRIWLIRCVVVRTLLTGGAENAA